MIFPFSFLSSLNKLINPFRTNLVVEYIADHLASDGSSQPDSSGNSNTAIATTGPIKQANAANGHASMKFTGSQLMTLTNAITGTGDVTIYSVQKRTSGNIMVSLASSPAGSVAPIEYTDNNIYFSWDGATVSAGDSLSGIFRIISAKSSSSALNQWINGQLLSNSNASLAAVNLNQIGSYASINSSGELLYVCLYNTAHSDATRKSIESALAKAFNIKYILFVGDSITYGYPASSPGGITGNSYPATTYPLLQGSETSFQGANIGISGETIVTMRANAPTNVDPFLFGGARIYFEGGYNDIGSLSADAPTLIASYMGFITDRLTAGWLGSQIYAITLYHVLYPVAGIGWGSDPNPIIDTVNAAIIANASTYGYKVIDVSQNSFLNDAANTTYRQLDGLHLTETGYALLGQYAFDNS